MSLASKLCVALGQASTAVQSLPVQKAYQMQNTPINWAAIGIAVTVILAIIGGVSGLTKAVFAHLNKNTEILTQLLSKLQVIVDWMGEAKTQFDKLTSEVHELRIGQTELRGELHGETKQLAQRLERVEDKIFTK